MESKEEQPPAVARTFVEEFFSDEGVENFAWWGESFAHFAPPTALTVDEWADTHRMIAAEYSASPGAWKTERIEFMREVMRAASPADECKRVVLLKPVQIGGSESLVLNVIGHTIDVAPRSMLVVFPTLDLAQGFSRERIEPMIALHPRLAARVAETRVGASSGLSTDRSTLLAKRYPGGFLNLVGANSTSGLSSRAVPLAIMDEVDACVQNAGRGGNPVKLLTARTSTFTQTKKEIFIGSPSNEEEETGIAQLWRDSSRGSLETLCPDPACATWQVLDFARMDIESAKLNCCACGQAFAQWEWNGRDIKATQRFVHEDDANRQTRGFRLNALNSPWLDWRRDICDEYKEAKRVSDLGDDSLMRVFVNTRLAECYKMRGKRVEFDFYHERREPYACHALNAELPDEVLVVTASVDVMDAWLAYEIVGWGKNKESWGIETGVIEGDPRASAVWERLDKLVYTRALRYSDKALARVRIIFVDSGGHCTTEVYRYARKRHPRVFAIKGVGGVGHAMIIGGKQRERAEGAWLLRLGVDALKDDVVAKLLVESPDAGGGFCHWPCGSDGEDVQGYNEAYFRELIAEQRVLKYSKMGFAKFEWHKQRSAPNEAFDLRVYNRAALEYLRVRLESMSRDAIKNVNERDVERIEAGLGREILSLKLAPKRSYALDRTTQFAAGQQQGAGGAPGGAGAPRERRSSTQYGAVSTSF